MTKSLALILAVSLFSLASFARTLIVSDIDDTLKISHILSLEKIATAPNISSEFKGMSELYQALDQSSDDVHFIYVSNAPSWLMSEAHHMFLSFNRFPEGALYMQNQYPVSEHKLRTISAQIEALKPDKVIMIGDNGEADVDIYAAVQARFPQLESLTYIHQVYSVASKTETGRALKTGQIGYVTAIDLGLQMKKSGLLSEPVFESFVSRVAPQVWEEPEFFWQTDAAFPRWMNCGDFMENFETQDHAWLFAIKQKTQKYCH